MRYTITGRNIDVTPGLRAAIEEKIGKLERYFLPDTEIIVTLSVQKDKQKIEVTIPMKGSMIMEYFMLQQRLEKQLYAVQ